MNSRLSCGWRTRTEQLGADWVSECRAQDREPAGFAPKRSSLRSRDGSPGHVRVQGRNRVPRGAALRRERGMVCSLSARDGGPATCTTRFRRAGPHAGCKLRDGAPFRSAPVRCSRRWPRPVQTVPCHNDLHRENLLCDAPGAGGSSTGSTPEAAIRCSTWRRLRASTNSVRTHWCTDVRVPRGGRAHGARSVDPGSMGIRLRAMALVSRVSGPGGVAEADRPRCPCGHARRGPS